MRHGWTFVFNCYLKSNSLKVLTIFVIFINIDDSEVAWVKCTHCATAFARLEEGKPAVLMPSLLE